jgi:hypothetical protein
MYRHRLRRCQGSSMSGCGGGMTSIEDFEVSRRKMWSPDLRSWGSPNLVKEGDARTKYLEAIRAADNGDIQPLLTFARSCVIGARSLIRRRRCPASFTTQSRTGWSSAVATPAAPSYRSRWLPAWSSTNVYETYASRSSQLRPVPLPASDNAAGCFVALGAGPRGLRRPARSARPAPSRGERAPETASRS